MRRDPAAVDLNSEKDKSFNPRKSTGCRCFSFFYNFHYERILTMTDKLFFSLFSAALSSPNRDAFVSVWSLSPVWGDAPDAGIPADRIDLLARLWDAAHLTIRDIRQHTGLSQVAFATRYCIPTRTLEDWERGVRRCPDYLRLLLAQDTGLYTRP